MRHAVPFFSFVPLNHLWRGIGQEEQIRGRCRYTMEGFKACLYCQQLSHVHCAYLKATNGRPLLPSLQTLLGTPAGRSDCEAKRSRVMW